MRTEEDCIFCKIGKGVISSRCIYEDNMFKVILDMNPITKGHALIFPKNHCKDLFDMPEEVSKVLMVTIKKVAVIMRNKLNCQGFNLLHNSGAVAGQTVGHFHIHLIPRYNEDGQTLACAPIKISSGELDQISMLFTE